MDAVKQGIYQKSMHRHKWTEEEIIAKYTMDPKVNKMWAQAMLEGLLGNEARQKYQEVYK